MPESHGPGMASPLPPFKFAAHRTRIHWHTLHGVDIDKLVRSPLSEFPHKSHNLLHTAFVNSLQPIYSLTTPCKGC